MIFLGKHAWPLAATPFLPYNTSFFCPYSNEIWAVVLRHKTQFYSVNVLPKEGQNGDGFYPAPGSLLWWTGRSLQDGGEMLELPRDLLWREITLELRCTSTTEPCYNVAPNGAQVMNQALMQEIAALRAKEAAGTLTDEELRTILRKMREGRVTASARSASARTAKAVVDPDAALASFLT